MAETPRHGDILVGTESVLQTVFVYINSLKKISATSAKNRVKSKDRTVEEVGTNDKKVFIQLNRLLSGYRGTQSFLNSAL